MQTKIFLLAVLGAVTVFAGTAAAGPRSVVERVAITSPKGNSVLFVLTPLTSGPVAPDSGSASACCWSRRFVKRDGQAAEIDNPLRTFVGKHGTFVWRAQIAWVDLENYSIGTGTWRIVRGTGVYAHMHGHGRLAIVDDSAENGLADRAEGLVSLGG